MANPFISQGRKLRLREVKWLIPSPIAKICPLSLPVRSLPFLWKIRRNVMLALDTRPYTYRCSANICWMNPWMNAILCFSVSVHVVTIKRMLPPPPPFLNLLTYKSSLSRYISSYFCLKICPYTRDYKGNLLDYILALLILSCSLIIFRMSLFSITRLYACVLKYRTLP